MNDAVVMEKGCSVGQENPTMLHVRDTRTSFYQNIVQEHQVRQSNLFPVSKVLGLKLSQMIILLVMMVKRSQRVEVGLGLQVGHDNPWWN